MNTIDARVSEKFAGAIQQSAVLRKIADICAMQIIWFMAGGFGLTIYYLSRAVVDAFARRLVVGVLLAWAVTILLEYVFRRRRPFQAQGRPLPVGMLWVPPSFPSGHATIAFALATATYALEDATLFGIALALAVCVSLGRVAVRVHYLTDVLAGAAVGWVVTTVVLRYL